MDEQKFDVYGAAKELLRLPAGTDSSKWLMGKKLLYTEKLPGLWARICLTAAALTEELELNIWFLIECVNGLRRQSGKWDVGFASGLLDEIKHKIDRIPGNRIEVKTRLTELWCYHSAWVYHPAGLYAKAAACHRIAMTMAGNERDRLLASYNSCYEEMHLKIVDADSKLTDFFGQYREVAEETLKVLSSDNNDDIRWRANIQCHLTFFTWLLSGVVDEGSALEAMEKLPEDISPAFSGARLVFEALSVMAASPDQAAEIAGGYDPKDQIDWRSYAMYIQGLALRQVGKEDGTKKVFDHLRVLNKNENGGHLVRALIDRKKIAIFF